MCVCARAGNLSYSVSPTDVETVLAGSGFDNFQNIHISIDPVSARNPGYCFVDFADRETAERALSELSATINGRDLKVGPCEPKKPREKRHETAFQRWGDWRSGPGPNGDESPRSGNGYNRRDNSEQGPRGALNHYEDAVDGNDGRRLYVGGLPKVVDQAQNAEEMGELFAGLNPYVTIVTAAGESVLTRWKCVVLRLESASRLTRARGASRATFTTALSTLRPRRRRARRALRLMGRSSRAASSVSMFRPTRFARTAMLTSSLAGTVRKASRDSSSNSSSSDDSLLRRAGLPRQPTGVERSRCEACVICAWQCNRAHDGNESSLF